MRLCHSPARLTFKLLDHLQTVRSTRGTEMPVELHQGVDELGHLEFSPHFLAHADFGPQHLYLHFIADMLLLVPPDDDMVLKAKLPGNDPRAHPLHQERVNRLPPWVTTDFTRLNHERSGRADRVKRLSL